MPDARQAISSYVQKGGPIAVVTGQTSSAITFGYAFADNNYQIALEFIGAGAPPAAQWGTALKSNQYAIMTLNGNVVSCQFNWQAWRIA
jgi:hypothetical protein